MGSSASIQLKCPDDYDKTKFDKILKLYDKLDSNGDHIVETDELKEISELHIQNKIRAFQRKEKVIEDNTNIALSKAEFVKQQKIKQINSEYESEVVNINEMKVINLKKCQEAKDKYNSLPEEQKSKEFIKAVGDKSGHIEFWKFFEYMKNKTDDIVNIDF